VTMKNKATSEPSQVWGGKEFKESLLTSTNNVFREIGRLTQSCAIGQGSFQVVVAGAGKVLELHSDMVFERCYACFPSER